MLRFYICPMFFHKSITSRTRLFVDGRRLLGCENLPYSRYLQQLYSQLGINHTFPFFAPFWFTLRAILVNSLPTLNLILEACYTGIT